jgi:predicted DNA-binding transcriptional regulator
MKQKEETMASEIEEKPWLGVIANCEDPQPTIDKSEIVSESAPHAPEKQKVEIVVSEIEEKPWLGVITICEDPQPTIDKSEIDP